jgi:hypothetical protein
MIHVRKRDWMGCAVAAVAMISNRSYAAVANHWPKLDLAWTRTPQGLCALLEAVTEFEWRFFPRWSPQPRVGEWSRRAGPVPAFIQDKPRGAKLAQWIVVQDGVVYDSSQQSPQPMGQYQYRDWVVMVVARPGPPEELARACAREPIPKLRGSARVGGRAEPSVATDSGSILQLSPIAPRAVAAALRDAAL